MIYINPILYITLWSISGIIFHSYLMELTLFYTCLNLMLIIDAVNKKFEVPNIFYLIDRGIFFISALSSGISKVKYYQSTGNIAEVNRICILGFIVMAALALSFFITLNKKKRVLNF